MVFKKTEAEESIQFCFKDSFDAAMATGWGPF